MIKNVIFDVGDVLLDFPWPAYTAKNFDPETAAVLDRAFWTSGIWPEQDRNIMTPKQILDAFKAQAPGYEAEVQWAYDHVGEAVYKNPYTIPLLKKLKSMGYSLYYLSNFHEHLMQANPLAFDFLPYMDGGIFSCFEKVIKPDARIYERILEKYHLNLEECVFIDDNINNIKGAQDVGFNTIQFINHKETDSVILKYLEENGIK